MAAKVDLDPFPHVVDQAHLELYTLHVPLPAIDIGSLHFQITKFMVMEVVAAALCLIIFIPLARHLRRRPNAHGPLANFFEGMLVFLRDDVARSAIGHPDGDRFLPYLATAFVFILFCNLLGMIPFGASATSSLMVTGALALCTFLAIHGSGIKRMGPVGYFRAMVPPVPKAVWPLVFFSELIGHVTKTLALAIRLFANMFAGHMVLFVILYLIVLFRTVSGSGLVGLAAAPLSVGLVVALSLLEIFVAFLQAFIFTFLSALFIGMAVHPHH
ncbi:MAG: F0F1 ATP synthase subunit A [Planctomycetes bacterium]|nr:F0F1 ATP synthase subunit A [Planctomycetota bacterium]